MISAPCSNHSCQNGKCGWAITMGYNYKCNCDRYYTGVLCEQR